MIRGMEICSAYDNKYIILSLHVAYQYDKVLYNICVLIFLDKIYNKP